MDRRRFLGTASTASILAALAPGEASAVRRNGGDAANVDEYFLDPGNLSEADQRGLEQLVRYHEAAAEGADALRPRGSGRAPTYRLLHWSGALGDPRARLTGPLALRPAFRSAARLRLNAQILEFHVSSEDWKSGDEGTLTFELRGLQGREPMTWLFAEMFEAHDGGVTTMAREFLAQRGGRPDPVILSDPTIDLRIQLMRTNRKKSFFPKVLAIATGLLGAPLLGVDAGAPAASLPPLRVPRMAAEGVALSQAVLSGATNEKPIWRSGFASYGLADGGSRLTLAPGLWVVLDDGREMDLRGVTLGDTGGHLHLLRDGAPLDLNYLVLDLRIEAA